MKGDATMNNSPDNEKLKNAVLYLLQNAPTKPGVTVLLKMLYFADYRHYREHLSPITGAEYVALKNGPVINDYKQLFAELVEQGALVERAVPSGGQWPKTEYVPQQAPDTTVFTPTELEVLNTVLRECGPLTGTRLSDMTHREGPWSLVYSADDEGRPIPYMLFRWVDNLPDEQDAEMARARIAQPDVAEVIATLRSA
jgi:uncharacterized phage-associated protein